MPHVAMKHEKDPKEVILESLGDFKDFKLYNNQVLVAVYMRPEKTSGGILLPSEHLNEDKYQSKVGLVISMGPEAFKDDSGKWSFKDVDVTDHDWIVFRPSDGWQITVNKVHCRILDDTDVRGKVNHPDIVW